MKIYFQQIQTLMLLFLLLLFIEGCSSYDSVTSEHRNEISDSEMIYKVEKRNRDFIEFSQDTLNQARIRDSVIIGMQTDGSIISIPIEDVRRIYTKQPSATATIVNVGIFTVAIGGIIYAISHGGGMFGGSSPPFGGPL